jgi:CheY-like chemotaxis protein
VVATSGLTNYPIRIAEDGAAALSIMTEEIPSLVLLDLRMPGMNGFDVLDRMRGNPRTRQVPVLILTAQILNLHDVRRIEQHANVVLQSKDILANAEIIAALHRSLFGADTLPPQTSALVKRAIAYMHQNYVRPLARWEIAEAVGASENYLTHIFNQELGLKPWDNLNRFRVSRVFHKLIGVSPNEFREQLNA